jgi:site-specific DNA recombinase
VGRGTHALLQVNGRIRAGASRRGKVDFLLKSLLSGPDGRTLTPWHTTKANGRTYRYYLSTRDTHERPGTSGLPRLPAGGTGRSSPNCGACCGRLR